VFVMATEANGSRLFHPAHVNTVITVSAPSRTNSVVRLRAHGQSFDLSSRFFLFEQIRRSYHK